jgi:hypothetical protein
MKKNCEVCGNPDGWMAIEIEYAGVSPAGYVTWLPANPPVFHHRCVEHPLSVREQYKYAPDDVMAFLERCPVK